MLKSYIHDPEFEVDYLMEEEEEDEYMSMCGRFYTIHCMAIDIFGKNMEEFDEAYVGALFRDLMDLMDDALEQNEFVHYRESIYLFFKTLQCPLGERFLALHTSFAEQCLRIAEEAMEIIDIKMPVGNTQETELWKNTRVYVNDFFLYRFE